MPSLSMKKKSNVCCVKEKNCLRISHKSSIISKRSILKTSPITGEFDSCGQSCQEVSPNSIPKIQDTGLIENTNSNELTNGEDIFKHLTTSFSDLHEMELPPVSCSTNMGTIFSPTFCQIDVRDMPNSNDDAGVYINPDPLNFNTGDESCDGPTFDGNFTCDNISEKLIIPPHVGLDSNLFFNGTEHHATLPFLDVPEKARMDSDNSSFLLAIHQICPGQQETGLISWVDSDEGQYFDPHSFIRNLPDLSEIVPSTRPTILPKESRERKPVTLVLDLDETLVHSTLEPCADVDFTFKVFFNMKENIVYVKERPHLRTFLKKVAEMFEIVIFTASQSIYAEQLLDILDPEGKLISGRAYRESCIFSDGSYTKDLTVLGLDLAKVLIVDNSPQVFRLQVNNGIPIKSWFDDRSDNELMSLIPFLETLANVDDVRPLIAKKFGKKE